MARARWSRPARRRAAPRRSRSAAPTQTAGSWFGTTSHGASFTWTTARSMASARLSRTPTSRRPTCDSQPYLKRLDRQCERFGFAPDMVGLNAGYYTPQVCHGLEQREIAGAMGYRTPNRRGVTSTSASTSMTPAATPTHLPGRPGVALPHDQPARLPAVPLGALAVRAVSRASALHAKREPDQGRGASRLGGGQGGGRCAPADPVGQAGLCPTQGDRRTQLRRRHAVAWPSLRTHARAVQGARAVPVGRGNAEHEEDRAAAGAAFTSLMGLGSTESARNPLTAGAAA